MKSLNLARASQTLYGSRLKADINYVWLLKCLLLVEELFFCSTIY